MARPVMPDVRRKGEPGHKYQRDGTGVADEEAAGPRVATAELLSDG